MKAHVLSDARLVKQAGRFVWLSVDAEKEAKAARGRLETEKRVYVVAKSEVELAHDRYAELKRRHDALRKEHDELIEAVRQAAREERKLAERAERSGKGAGAPAAPAAAPTPALPTPAAPEAPAAPPSELPQA